MSESIRNFIADRRSELAEIMGDEHEAEFELRLMLAHVLKVSKISFFDMNSELHDSDLKSLSSMIMRRLNHEPLQYILGEWEFMGQRFYVDENVLIPRQDTETLAEIAETIINKRGFKSLLDICTGSGCIGISVAKRTGIAAALSDISVSALKTAKRNALLNDVSCAIVKSDLFREIDGRFDVITANPPYIESSVCNSLQPEVQFEPRIALDGGDDGLKYYHRIREDFAAHLTPNGILIMEIGYNQGKSVPALFEGLGRVNVYKDLCGNERVVTVEMRME